MLKNKKHLLSSVLAIAFFLLMWTKMYTINSSYTTENHDWITTTATIDHVEKITKIRSHGKSRFRPQTIVNIDLYFTTHQGEAISTKLVYEGIPFLGTIKKKDNQITIKYRAELPQITATVSGHLFTKYAWLLFIAAFIISIALGSYKYYSAKK